MADEDACAFLITQGLVLAAFSISMDECFLAFFDLCFILPAFLFLARSGRRVRGLILLAVILSRCFTGEGGTRLRC